MTRKSLYIIGILVALLVIVTAAAAQDNGRRCDISGVWYSGGDFPYLWSITPLDGDRYYSETQPGFDNRQFGYVSWTNWTGEIVKRGRTYESFGMSYLVWDANAAPPEVQPSLLEVDTVHSFVELVDCNTMTNTIDFWGGYFAFNPDTMTLFQTPPDIDLLHLAHPEVVTLTETYHRMPTVCSGCQFAPAPDYTRHDWRKKRIEHD